MTMYRIDIWDPNQPNPSGGAVCQARLPHGLIGISKYVNGVGTGLGTRCRSNTVQGTNVIRVTAHGSTVAVYANGQRVISATDPDPIAYGGVGVGQIWETNGWFDNALVRDATSARTVRMMRRSYFK